jgi:ABC-2 type transport system permease protein
LSNRRRKKADFLGLARRIFDKDLLSRLLRVGVVRLIRGVGRAVVLGTALLVVLGLILSAVVLNMARQGMYLSEGIAGLMYLLCGVVFPISVLPGWLQPVSLALPPTYWLEGMRRAILGNLDGQLPSPLSTWSHAELTLALVVSTGVFSVFAWWFFRWSERRAWRNGRIEETTGA